MNRRTAAPLAVIDIGSNAVRMLVGARENKIIARHLFTRVPMELGRESYGANNIIAPPLQTRLIAALQGLQKIAEAMQVSRCNAVATAAVRDCKNQRQLLANIRRRTGLDIHVLGGDEEAEIIGEFVARQFVANNVLNADTGGGSTDCALITDGKIVTRATFAVGTARRNGGAAAAKHQLTTWLNAHKRTNMIVAASGGSARKMEAICGKITAARLEKLIQQAIKIPVARRAAVFALTPDRARAIVPAARIAQMILNAVGARQMRSIDGGLGEAILTKILMSPPPK